MIDRHRTKVAGRLDDGASTTEVELRDFFVDVRPDVKPLIRANRQELLVFLEAVELEGAFFVVTPRKDPSHAWWLSSYEMAPGAGRAIAEVAAVTAQVTLELGYHFLVACGECVSHCH